MGARRRGGGKLQEAGSRAGCVLSMVCVASAAAPPYAASPRLSAVLAACVCLGGGLCGAVASPHHQSWAKGFPRLQFGAAALSPVATFPEQPGAWIPAGGAPQDLVIRLKASPDGAAYFTAGTVVIEVQLTNFEGSDNAWSRGDTGLRVIVLDSNGIFSDRGNFVAHKTASTWTATRRTLTLALENIQESDIKDSEIIVIMAASSFTKGSGPVPPQCLHRDAPLYVKKFWSAGAEVPQFRGSLGAVSPIGCTGETKVPFGVSKNAWSTKKIGQRSRANGVGMDVTITVTIASRLTIFSLTSSVKSEIIISGLVGSQTSDTDSIPIEMAGSQLYSADDLFQASSAAVNTGRWRQATGSLILTLKDDKTIPAHIPFVFSFKLKLPAEPLEAAKVSIEARTGTNIIIPSQLMDSASGDAAPLRTRKRTFSVAKIGQTVSGGGQFNEITISLLSNFDIQSTASYVSKIVISGLTGSHSPDSSTEFEYPIVSQSRESVQGIFSDGTRLDRAGWLKGPGQLTLHILKGRRLKAGSEYVFFVTLLNRIDPQASPQVSIQVTGETDTEIIEMQSGVDNESPMLISQPAMSIAKIEQSTSSVGARNTLTVSLMSTAGIQTSSGGQISGAVTISGLTGFQDPSGQIAVTNKGYNSVQGLFQNDSGYWDKSAGSIVLTLANGKQLSASKLYVFTVPMTNPGFARESPDVTIEISGPPSTSLKKVIMKKAPGKGAPLHIDIPDFKVLRAGQMYSGAGISNQVSVTMQPNLFLSAGHRLTIEGLVGSGTSDEKGMPLKGCDGIFHHPITSTINQGRWSQSSGTLELHAASSILAENVVSCSFELINPPAPQEAPAISITVNSVANGHVSTVIGPKEFRNAPGDRAPFKVSAAKFRIAKISQSTPYPGHTTNRITVSLQTNVVIGTVGGIVSSLTITGLKGSDTADNGLLPLEGDAVIKMVVEPTASWTKESGTLIVTIGSSKTMKANTVYAFSFLLANPTTGQASPAIQISSDGAQPISSMAMTSDSESCIHTTGDKAPLFIYARGFLKKDIGVTASWSQDNNIVSITLQSTVDISSLSSSRSSIRISGLTFDTNFNSNIPMSTSAPFLFESVQWTSNSNATQGVLTIQISAGQTMVAGTMYQIDVPLKNRMEESVWKPMISVSGPTEIEAYDMRYDGHESPVQVSLTSLQAASDTGLSFTFVTSQGISKSDSIIISLPGFEGISTKSKEQIWGVTSDPPAFSIESNKVEYADSIAEGKTVAQAKFRSGSSGRTELAASETNGRLGSTIMLESTDANVYGHDNLYAGMKISIDGSPSYHNIFQQTPSTPGFPAIAHFYPTYIFGQQNATVVPAGTHYTIHAQLELTSKSNICAGSIVRITVPRTGITVPTFGIQEGIRLSHVKKGLAKAVIGTSQAIASAHDQYSGMRGRTVQAVLDGSSLMNFEGLVWAPNVMPTSNFVFVDGFRSIDSFNASKHSATLFSGYGPIRKAVLSQSFGLSGVQLDHYKSIEPNSLWLTLKNASLIQPSLTRGSYLQLRDELLRFTGDTASGVRNVTLPAVLGNDCTLNGQSCGADNTCATIIFSGCSDNPVGSVAFNLGSVTQIILRYNGACDNRQQTLLTGALILSPGVACQTNPACSSGCKFQNATNIDSVVKVDRAQFSTRATSLDCNVVPCTDWVQSSTVYLENHGLMALTYTNSTHELVKTKAQSVKLAYSEIADTVLAGDHIVHIGPPESNGSNCRQDGVECIDGIDCATILFSGCSINPEAYLKFHKGRITEVILRGSDDNGRFGQSICQAEEVLVGTITLAKRVVCDETPKCGTGCSASRDSAKDTLIIKHNPSASNVHLNSGADVVRVHKTQEVGYEIVFVPPTLCTVGVAPVRLQPGECALAPKKGSVMIWIDPDTDGVLASMYASRDGLLSICLDFLSDRQDFFPLDCKVSCLNQTATGHLVASKSVNITLKHGENSSAIDVFLSMPITFNTAHTILRRAAPKEFEYRLNGNCTCPATSRSQNSSVNCSISASGIYQASLVRQAVCASTRKYSILIGIVCGAAGLLLILLAAFMYDRSYRRPNSEKETDIPTEPEAEATGKDAEEVFEGPVFVGRPVPIPPNIYSSAGMPQTATEVPTTTPVPLSASAIRTSWCGQSAAFAPDTAGWNDANTFFSANLPATFTPEGSGPQGSSPLFSMPSSMLQNRVNRPLPPTPVQGDSEHVSLRFPDVLPNESSLSQGSRGPLRTLIPYGV